LIILCISLSILFTCTEIKDNRSIKIYKDARNKGSTNNIQPENKNTRSNKIISNFAATNYCSKDQNRNLSIKHAAVVDKPYRDKYQIKKEINDVNKQYHKKKVSYNHKVRHIIHKYNVNKNIRLRSSPHFRKHRIIHKKKKLRRRVHKVLEYPSFSKSTEFRKTEYKICSNKNDRLGENQKNINNLDKNQNLVSSESGINDSVQEEKGENNENYELTQKQTRSPVERLNEQLQERSVLAEVKLGYSCVKGNNLPINAKQLSEPVKNNELAASTNNEEPISNVSNIKKPMESPIYLNNRQQPDNYNPTAYNATKISSINAGNQKNISKSNRQFYNINAPSVHNNATVKSKSTKIDYNKVKTSVVMLRINDKLNYDFEAIVWPDKQISVPIKNLANLIDVETTQNHLTSSVSFEQPFTQEKITVDHQKNQIIIGSNVLSNIDPKLMYFKDGFIISDDIYVPLHIADELLNVKTSFSTSKYILDLKTSKILKAMVKLDVDPNETSSFVYQEPFQSISANQAEKKLFTMKQFNYNIGSSFQRSISDNTANNSNNSNAGIMATGSMLGGDYRIGTNSLYNNSSMELNGYTATLDYKRPNYDLSLGKTNAILSQLAAPGVSLWGIRLGSVGANGGAIEVPRCIMGRAEENSMAELFINDIFIERQQVKNGEYAFDFVKYPHDYSVKVRVDQLSQDNSRKVIYEHKFSLDRRLLVPGQKQLLIFSGIDDNGLNNRYKLFGNSLDTSLYEPVRYITGSKFRLGIFKKLTMGVNYADSVIIRNPEKQMPNPTSSLYMSKAFRMGRTSSGSVMSMDMDYAALKNLRLNTEGSFSRARSKIDPLYDPDGNDFGGLISADYNKDSFNLNLKGFSYGSNYYSGTTTNLIDQRGIEANSRINLGKASISGNIRSYNSNLDGYFNGGIAKVFEYGSNISGNIDQDSTISMGVRSFATKNSLYSEGNNAFDITYKRKFTNNLDMILNTIHNNLTQDNNDLNTSYKSANQLFNMQLNYDSKKLGIFQFSHQSYMMNTEKKLFTDEDNVSRDFTLRLDRSNKFYRGIAISPVIGYRYTGDSRGLITGFSASHRFKSGLQLIINYTYNSTCSGSLGGNLLVGGNRSHSLTFSLVQNVNFGVKKLVNAGSGEIISINPDNGIVKGTVFADLNQNGIKEADEAGIPGIDIKTSECTKVTTDKDGNYILVNLSEATHKFGIDKENLPAIYTPTVANALVNVKQRRVYVANLGITASPGSISGKVTIDKKGLSTTEVIIQLLDKNGKEVKYTTTDNEGNYSIDSISAGEYNVVVSKDYLDYLGLQDEKEKEHKIVIPPVFNDFIDIKNVDIFLSPMQSEAKKFSV